MHCHSGHLASRIAKTCHWKSGRKIAEYSQARRTRDKPEAGEYSSASYLHHYPAGEYSLASYSHHYLLRWLGSTPRPRTCIATYSAGWGVLLGQFATTTYSAGWGVLLGLLLASLLIRLLRGTLLWVACEHVDVHAVGLMVVTVSGSIFLASKQSCY